MKKIILLLMLCVSITQAQTNVYSENDTLEIWNASSDLSNFIGETVYLPQFVNFNKSSRRWFNHPFLYTKNFQLTDISQNFQLREHIKEKSKPFSDFVSPRDINFNNIYTNIYKPNFNSNQRTRSTSSYNDIQVSDEYYTIIDVISKSEMQVICNKWKMLIKEESNKTAQLKEKKKKWEQSSQTWVYRASYGNPRDDYYGQPISAVLLKSNKTNDTIYFIDYYQYTHFRKQESTRLFTEKFFLISNYNKLQEKYKNKTFICTDQFGYQGISFKLGSEWICKDVSISKSTAKMIFILEGEKGENAYRPNMDRLTLKETYLHEQLILKKEEEKKLVELKEKRDKEALERTEEERKKLEERTLKYTSKYGDKYGKLVALKKVEIGMTKAMVRDAIGPPPDYHRVQTGNITYDTWSYLPYLKLHFINDKLSQIESSFY